MKKLLLIENSQLFAKALSRSLAESNSYEIHFADSMARVKELLEQHNYFVAISNLVLPDAAEGEVIYKLIGREIPVICLTGSFNMQPMISALPVVDYVVKEGNFSVRYAVRLAELLLYTHGMKVLVLSDDDVWSSQTQAYLQPFRFSLVRHSCQSEAEAYLQQNPDTALILCDHSVAGGSGQDFIRSLRKKRDQLQHPVIFIGDHQTPELSAKLLKSGVNDFLIRPYSKEEFISRVFNLVNTRVRYTQVQDYAQTVDRYIITSTTDEAGIIRNVSQAFCDISGYTRNELIGRYHNIVRHPDMPSSIYREMWQTIRSGQRWQGELKNRKKDGGFYWVDVYIEPILDACGNISGYTAVRQDITDKKLIELLSVTDPMTGLFNRRHLNTNFVQLEEKIKEASVVLNFLIFDVDHFKAYNDNYGHQAGDKVLTDIGCAADQLAKQYRGFAYRLGGEEFALLFFSQSAADAELVAEGMRSAIEKLRIPHAYNSASDFVTASFGLLSLTEPAGIESTYKEADQRLYQAKESGRNRVCAH